MSKDTMKTYEEYMNDEKWVALKTKEFNEEIRSWDWKSIVEEASDNVSFDGYNDVVVGTAYLGSVFSIMPSGKYYTAWANSNVDGEDVALDDIFTYVLERVARDFGGYVDASEGDPTDLLFYLYPNDLPNPIKGLERSSFDLLAVERIMDMLNATTYLSNGRFIDFVLPEIVVDRDLLEEVVDELPRFLSFNSVYDVALFENKLVSIVRFESKERSRAEVVGISVNANGVQISFYHKFAAHHVYRSKISNASVARLEKLMNSGRVFDHTYTCIYKTGTYTIYRKKGA